MKLFGISAGVIMLYHIRNYVELSALYIRLKMKTDYFMDRFELSKYELKNDLERIKTMSKSYGVSIVHDDSYINLIIDDQELYDKYYLPFFSFYYLNRFTFNDNDIMLSLIVSSKILIDEVFSVERFSETIGYSKSSLRRPIKMARELLHSHGIETVNKPYYGLCVKGNEFFIRRCLCTIYTILVPELYCEDEDNQKLVQHVNYYYYYNLITNYLNTKNIIVHTEDSESVIYYLTITKDRIETNKYIDEIPNDDQLVDLVKDNIDLRTLAIELLNLIEVPLDEKEIHALMIVLLIHNYSIDSSIEYVQFLYMNEYNELRNRIYQNFYNHYGLKVNSNHYTKPIDEEIISLIIKHHTGNIDKIVHRAIGNAPNIYVYPLIYFINNSVCRIVKEYYHNDKISPAVTENIADVMYYFVDSLPYSYKKSNIAITSRTSNHTPKLVREKIIKDIDHSYLGKIDIIVGTNLLERDKYISEYNLVLTDNSINVCDKVLMYSDINSSTLKLENYLRMHRNICECISEGTFDIVVKNITAKSENEFVKAVVNDNVLNEDSIWKGIYYGFILRENIVIYIPDKGVDSLLQIGEISQTITLRNKKVSKYQIFKGKITSKNANILNIIFHELVLDPMFMEQLKSVPSVNTINDMLNMIIK